MENDKEQRKLIFESPAFDPKKKMKKVRKIDGKKSEKKTFKSIDSIKI